MEAYYNAMAQQDAGLATQAQQQGRDATAFGAGLFGTGTSIMNGAYAPMQTALGLGSTIESLGQAPLDLGAQLGGRSAQAGSQVGQFLMSGGNNAALTMQKANSFNPYGSALMGAANNTGFTNAAAGLFSGGGAPSQGFTPSLGAYGSGDAAAWWQ
jgi:hypothetical protein